MAEVYIRIDRDGKPNPQQVVLEPWDIVTWIVERNSIVRISNAEVFGTSRLELKRGLPVSVVVQGGAALSSFTYWVFVGNLKRLRKTRLAMAGSGGEGGGTVGGGGN